MGDVSRSSDADRVRVLEQYIRDMSIRNMQRMQQSAEPEKAAQREEELKARERAVATREAALEARVEEQEAEQQHQQERLRSAVLSQGHELASMRRESEKLRREHWVLTEQLSSGSRRLAHYVSRYLSENAKVWDLTASTTSTASTVSSLSHVSTSSQESMPAESLGLDGTLLRADDSTDYSTFPSEATLSCDPTEFMRKLRSDLKRLGLVDPQQLKPPVLSIAVANEPSTGWAENPELAERIDEVWKAVEDRVGRVEGGLRALCAQLELLSMDPSRTDCVLVRAIRDALLPLLGDVAQLPAAVKDVVDQVRQLSDDLAPLAKRIRLAESGFKIKEQRHALKVDLLEKRLQRLTGTLTSVQQASRREGCTCTADSFHMQSLEEQVLELTLSKFDADNTLEQLRQEERFRAKRKAAPVPTPERLDTSPFEGLGVFSAPAFALGPEWSRTNTHASSQCMFYPPQPLDLTV